jgi:hypothetical protein
MAAFRNPLLAGFGSDHYICHAVLTRPREMGQSAVLRGQRILCYVGITRHAVPTPVPVFIMSFCATPVSRFPDTPHTYMYRTQSYPCVLGRRIAGRLGRLELGLCRLPDSCSHERRMAAWVKPSALGDIAPDTSVSVVLLIICIQNEPMSLLCPAVLA